MTPSGETYEQKKEPKKEEDKEEDKDKKEKKEDTSGSSDEEEGSKWFATYRIIPCHLSQTVLT